MKTDSDREVGRQSAGQDWWQPHPYFQKTTLTPNSGRLLGAHRFTFGGNWELCPCVERVFERNSETNLSTLSM